MGYRLKVYIAGPYTKADPAINVRAAIEAGDVIAKNGGAPFIPHLTHFWHLLTPHDHAFWMEQDQVWLTMCDAVLRLPGDSKGADEEVAWAEAHGIPVFHALPWLLDQVRASYNATIKEV